VDKAKPSGYKIEKKNTDTVRIRPSIEGLICIDKPVSITSFKATDRIRKHLGVKKAGHTGTLDPSASGVLVVCLGRATRLAEHLQIGTKVYEATIHLGKTTDTDDSEGEIISETEIEGINRERVEEVVQRFTGVIMQTPPAYSAIRMGGERLYKKARAGEIMEIEPREVYIKSIDITDFNPPLLSIIVECGKGTYIRSLARDIGEALNCGAHLTSLRRLKNEYIDIDQCTPLNELLEMERDDILKSTSFIPFDDALPHIASIELNEGNVEKVRHGSTVEVMGSDRKSGLVQAKHRGKLIAIGHIKECAFKPEKVFI